MEYLIVNHYSLPGFEAAVRRALEDGWEAAGGVTSFASRRQGVIVEFAQAMIRKPPPGREPLVCWAVVQDDAVIQSYRHRADAERHANGVPKYRVIRMREVA